MRRIVADATVRRHAGDRSDRDNPRQVTLLLPTKVVVNGQIEYALVRRRDWPLIRTRRTASYEGGDYQQMLDFNEDSPKKSSPEG